MSIPAKDPHCGACITGTPHVHGRFPDPRIPETEPGTPGPGDWVLVMAQMVEDQTGTAGRNHAVRFESHNEHYVGLIRHDRVSLAAQPPEDAPQCNHLVLDTKHRLLRCESRQGRGHVHHHPKVGDWMDSATVGYFEER